MSTCNIYSGANADIIFSDVAAFQSDAVAKLVKSPAKLDAVEPNTYIKLTFLPTETDHTYEELPVVSPIHSSEPGVSTFKLATTPTSRPAVPTPELSMSDFNPYNQIESPTAEPTSFRTIKSNSESSYQQQILTLPGKRLEARSYSPVPSPPTIIKVPPSLIQKPINRAPMPLPKPNNTETRPTSDVTFVDLPSDPHDGFRTVDRAASAASRLDSCGKNESPKTIRSEQRREHPMVPIPPALKPIDLQKALKPTYKSVDLGMNSTFPDMETSEDRTSPRKAKPQKPRSKTDLSLSTSTMRLLQQETSRQDIKASELGCEHPERKLPVPKYNSPSVKSNKGPFSKTRASSPENDQDIADSNTSSPDYDELLRPESNKKTPLKVKLPPPLPRTDSKSSMPDNDVFCAASPKLPPPPPEFFLTEYECPSRDTNSPLPVTEPNAPKLPQLNYEKLPTKDVVKDAIESIADIPDQLDNLTCFQLADCLKLLNMDSYITTFLTNQIDGKLLLELDEEILTSDLNVTKLHAKKLLMFAHRGWRP